MLPLARTHVRYYLVLHECAARRDPRARLARSAGRDPRAGLAAGSDRGDPPSATLGLDAVRRDAELSGEFRIGDHAEELDRRAGERDAARRLEGSDRGLARGLGPAAGHLASRAVKLTPAEAAAQDAAAGDRPWATWAHDTLVARAAAMVTLRTLTTADIVWLRDIAEADESIDRETFLACCRATGLRSSIPVDYQRICDAINERRAF